MHNTKAGFFFFGIPLVFTLLLSAACSGPASPGGGSAAYSVGDTGPAGGIIVYAAADNSAGWQFLEAAPKTEVITEVTWGGRGTATGVKLSGSALLPGAGKENTETILTVLGSTTSAAKRASEFTYGGKTDWYLPSQDEMYAVLEQLVVFYSEWFWISNERSDQNAYAIHEYYGTGSTGQYAKDRSSFDTSYPVSYTATLNVWPVRRF